MPPNYGQVTSSSKVYRREGYLASVQIKLVIFTFIFFSSAECSYPAAAASLRCRKRSGNRPGHNCPVRSTHSERRRGQWPRHHDQLPATHKERRRGQRPVAFWPTLLSTCVAPRTSPWAPRLSTTPSAFVWSPSKLLVFIITPKLAYLPFRFGGSKSYSYIKKSDKHLVSPPLPLCRACV